MFTSARPPTDDLTGIVRHELEAVATSFSRLTHRHAHTCVPVISVVQTVV